MVEDIAMKKHAKKIIIALAIAVLFILLKLLLPDEVVDITDAVVNEENGDIAFSIYEDEILTVKLFDKDGKLIFSKELETWRGSPDMLFHKNNLYIDIGKSQSELVAFDKQGNSIKPEIPASHVRNIDQFNGWKHSGFRGVYEYELNGYTYKYEGTTIYRHKSKLSIIHNETQAVIYENPSA